MELSIIFFMGRYLPKILILCLYISLGKVLSFNENYNKVVKCYESSQTFYYLQVNKYEEDILQSFPNKITGMYKYYIFFNY